MKLEKTNSEDYGEIVIPEAIKPELQELVSKKKKDFDEAERKLER